MPGLGCHVSVGERSVSWSRPGHEGAGTGLQVAQEGRGNLAAHQVHQRVSQTRIAPELKSRNRLDSQSSDWLDRVFWVEEQSTQRLRGSAEVSAEWQEWGPAKATPARPRPFRLHRKSKVWPTSGSPTPTPTNLPPGWVHGLPPHLPFPAGERVPCLWP